MGEHPHKHDLENALKRLQDDTDAIPWTQRRELAAQVRTTLADGCKCQATLELVYLLAEDSKPEVRKEIADLVFLLPDSDFTRLVAKLTGDTSSFVQKAATKSLDRRRKGRQESQRIRRGFDRIQSGYSSIERSFGTKAAERARRIAEEEFGMLVGRTVHNMRGIISPLKTDVFQIISKMKPGSPEGVAEGMRKVQERLDYLERFIDDLREYSKATLAPRRREWVAAIVKEAVSWVHDNLQSNGFDFSTITLKTDVPENITASIARHQVQIGITHLLKNAYEAFDGVEQDTKLIEIRAQVIGDELCVIVEDNGAGMAEHELQTFSGFPPGETTKVNGTGFGLPTAHRYAVAHGGSLTLDSKEGKGTTVTLRLPLDYEDEDANESTCD